MSLNIGKMFHIVHVAEALGPLDAWYDDVFVPRRGIMDDDYLALEMREGSLLAIGDTVIETMAPSVIPAPRSCRWASSSPASAATSIRWPGTPTTSGRSGSSWSITASG